MAATVPGIHLGIDTHANRPAANTAPDSSLYSCSTHGLVYKSNFAGNSWATWATLGSVGGVASGTSFPGTPATDDLFYRTDHDTLYFYNGTRWLSVDLRERTMIPKGLPPYSSNDTRLYCPAWDSTYDVWIEDLVILTEADATNDGSNFWTFSFDKATNTGGSTALITSTTAADTAGQFIDKRVAVNALFGTTATNTWLIVGNAETGTAGAINWLSAYFTYRRVG